MVRTVSEELSHPECMSSSTAGRVSCGSNRFGRVEQPRTHEKLSYDPCSLWSSEVRRGSVGLNHPELMSSFTEGVVSRVELWFELVRKSWTTPNSCQVPPQAWFPVLNYGSNRFGRVKPPKLMTNYPVILVHSRAQCFEQVRKSWTTLNSCHVQLQAWFPVLNCGSNMFVSVEQPRTHEKLADDPCSIWSSEVRQRLVGLNNPKLMRDYPMILFPSVALWFEQVRESWTTLNSCQVPPQGFKPPWTIVKFPSNLCSTEG